MKNLRFIIAIIIVATLVIVFDSWASGGMQYFDFLGGGTLTNGKVCLYNSTTGKIDCNGEMTLQTPWTANVDGGGYSLSNVGTITSTNINNSNVATTSILCFASGECMASPMNVGSGVTLYHWNDSAEIATYEQLATYPDSSGTNEDESCSADADVTGGYCDIDPYISTTTDLSISSIPAGDWRFRYYTYVSNTTGNSKLEVTAYKRDTGGTETQLFQATSSDINLTTVGETLFSSTQGAFVFGTTDRLVLKVRAWTDQNNAKTIHFLYGGASSNYSHVVTPITIGNFNFARKDLDETITGSWTVSGSWTFSNTILGTADYAISLAEDPDNCGANTWANASDESGNLTCSAVTYAGITAMTSANFAGLINDETGTAGTVVLSVGPTLTGVTTLANASTTVLTVTTGYLGTLLGTIDAGGATSFEIPNSTDVTVDAAGEIAINTTAASSSIRFATSSTEIALYPEKEYTLTIGSSSLIYDWDGLSATSTIPIGFASRHGETWLEVTGACNITTGVDFGDGTNYMNYTNFGTATSTTIMGSNNTFTLRENRWIRIKPSAATFKWCTFTPVIRPNAD